MKLQSLIKAAAFGVATIAASAALANGGDYKVAPAASQGAYNGAGFVLGAQAGYADTHWNNPYNSSDVAAINRAINSLGIRGSLDTTDTGFAGRLYVGYDFNNYFGTELGYIYLPKAKVKFGGTELYSIKNYAVDLFGKLSMPIANGFGVYAKAGAAYFKSTAGDDDDSLNLLTGSASHVGPAYGVGLFYQITPQFAADLSWTRYSGEGKWDNDYQPNPDVFMFGLSYKFPVNFS